MQEATYMDIANIAYVDPCMSSLPAVGAGEAEAPTLCVLESQPDVVVKVSD